MTSAQDSKNPQTSDDKMSLQQRQPGERDPNILATPRNDNVLPPNIQKGYEESNVSITPETIEAFKKRPYKNTKRIKHLTLKVPPSRGAEDKMDILSIFNFKGHLLTIRNQFHTLALEVDDISWAYDLRYVLTHLVCASTTLYRVDVTVSSTNRKEEGHDEEREIEGLTKQ